MSVVPWSLNSWAVTVVSGLSLVRLGWRMREPVTTTSPAVAVWPLALWATPVASGVPVVTRPPAGPATGAPVSPGWETGALAGADAWANAWPAVRARAPTITVDASRRSRMDLSFKIIPSGRRGLRRPPDTI